MSVKVSVKIMGTIMKNAALAPSSLFKSITLLLVVACTLSVTGVKAGDAKAGEQKAQTCAACHGADGVSTIVTNPILAGQYPSYLEQALKSYRDGSRQSAIMAGFAAQLSDEDIADLAAWFASQNGPLQTAPTP